MGPSIVSRKPPDKVWEEAAGLYCWAEQKLDGVLFDWWKRTLWAS